MNAFHSWELEGHRPLPRAAGETVAAELCGRELDITRIREGRRERVATYPVAGKREARALAAKLDATPWNF